MASPPLLGWCPTSPSQVLRPLPMTFSVLSAKYDFIVTFCSCLIIVSRVSPWNAFRRSWILFSVVNNLFTSSYIFLVGFFVDCMYLKWHVYSWVCVLVALSCLFLVRRYLFLLKIWFNFWASSVLWWRVAGIMFQDITTLLLDTKAFKNTIDMFVERYKNKNISVVAGWWFFSQPSVFHLSFLSLVFQFCYSRCTHRCFLNKILLVTVDTLSRTSSRYKGHRLKN